MRTRSGMTLIGVRRDVSFIVAALAAALIGVSFVAARNWTHRHYTAADATPPARPPAADVKAGAERPPVEVLSVYLRRPGFAPKEITRPAGDYFLSVNNYSGVPDVVLRLDREQGSRLHEAKVTRDRPGWRQNVRLTPGVYLLTETGHPNWVCRITITPQ